MFVTRRRHEMVVDELNAQINRLNKVLRDSNTVAELNRRAENAAHASLASQLLINEAQRATLTAVNALVDHNIKATVVAKSKLREILRKKPAEPEVDEREAES